MVQPCRPTEITLIARKNGLNEDFSRLNGETVAVDVAAFKASAALHPAATLGSA